MYKWSNDVIGEQDDIKDESQQSKVELWGHDDITMMSEMSHEK